MFIITEHPNAKTAGAHLEMRALAVASARSEDLVVTERDRVYARCFQKICQMRLRPDWESTYSRWQAESARILRIQERTEPELGADLLDLTMILIDVLGAGPGDAFWPEVRMLRTLRISVEKKGGLDVLDGF